MDDPELLGGVRPYTAPAGTWPMEEWPMNVIMTDQDGRHDLMSLDQLAHMTVEQRFEALYRARCGLARPMDVGTALNRPAFDGVFRKIEACPCFGRGTFEGPCDCEKLDLMATESA